VAPAYPRLPKSRSTSAIIDRVAGGNTISFGFTMSDSNIKNNAGHNARCVCRKSKMRV
jgi:hypothetical protein